MCLHLLYFTAYFLALRRHFLKSFLRMVSHLFGCLPFLLFLMFCGPQICSNKCLDLLSMRNFLVVSHHCLSPINHRCHLPQDSVSQFLGNEKHFFLLHRTLMIYCEVQNQKYRFLYQVAGSNMMFPYSFMAQSED